MKKLEAAAVIKPNIVLIGMPGAGTSTVGVLLAKTLGMSFVDTDLLLQQRTGRLLQEIIDRDGIDSFLRLEEQTVLDLTVDDSIIATGGSVVYSAAAMRRLREQGMVLYLRADLAAIESRLSQARGRGIVIGRGQELADLFRERTPLYERYADVVLDCTGRDIEQVVSMAVEAVQ